MDWWTLEGMPAKTAHSLASVLLCLCVCMCVCVFAPCGFSKEDRNRQRLHLRILCSCEAVVKEIKLTSLTTASQEHRMRRCNLCQFTVLFVSSHNTATKACL